MYDQRCQIIRLTREFFWSQGFTETDTPIALKLPGQEPYLSPVPIVFHSPTGKEEQLYLHTSPEFGLKKLLAAGYKKVFSVVKCFRDYEAFGDGTHNTEFTMLEWYRAPGSYFDFMDDTEKLFQYIGRALGKTSVEFRGQTCAIAEKWDRKTMNEVWQEFVGVNLDDYLTVEAMSKLVENKGYPIGTTDAYEDLFFKVFLNEIEPKLGLDRPVFVYEYPKQMCSLSRVCAHDSRYAERAELYSAGLELANGFGELVDPEEQCDRLEADRQLRERLGKESWPVDPDFIAALASGMPEAGGIALGIDRMVVLFTGAKDINEVLFQSVQDQLSI